MIRFSFCAAAAALTLASASAQVLSNAGTRLIGFTSDGSSPSTSPPLIQRQTLCADSTIACPTGMAPAAAEWAGGAAYNAINSSVWHTQGTRMSELRLEDCALLCSVPAHLVLGPGSLATDLTICESRLELYQLESEPGAAAMHTRHLRSCPLNVLASCRFTLPTNRHIAGAMALDEKNGVFYYATSVFGPITSTAGPQNTVLVARAGDPCNILCSFPVVDCGPNRLGPITAMVFDACENVLYVSDGRQTTVRRQSPLAICDYPEVRHCAPSPTRQTWHGFDLEPVHARPVGQSCLGAGCTSCNSMRLDTTGDATIGNPFFSIDVRDGQDGAISVLALGRGPCLVPGAIALCGAWHVNNPFFLYGQTLAGSAPGACDGGASWPIPIPYVWELCDVTLCAQAVTLCVGPGGPGVGLTNALQIAFGN